jgi:hypothetical protein
VAGNAVLDGCFECLPELAIWNGSGKGKEMRRQKGWRAAAVPEKPWQQGKANDAVARLIRLAQQLQQGWRMAMAASKFSHPASGWPLALAALALPAGRAASCASWPKAPGWLAMARVMPWHSSAFEAKERVPQRKGTERKGTQRKRFRSDVSERKKPPKAAGG